MEHATGTLSQQAGVGLHVMELGGIGELPRKAVFANCPYGFKVHD